MPLTTLAGLLFINIVWSAHPIIGKLLLLEMTPLEAAWVRYFSAFCAYLAIVLTSSFVAKFEAKRSFSNWSQFFIVPDKASDKVLIVALGIMTFCLSPFLQMRGLTTSLATENAIIVALEPLMTVFLAWLILKESVTRFDLLGFCLACVGFGILAELDPIGIWRSAVSGGRLDSHLSGNLLLALSLVGEASFAIIGKKLIRNYSPLQIFGSALAVGVLCLTAAVAGMFLTNELSINGPSISLFHVDRWEWKTFLAAFWIGPLGTTAGYLIYITALVDVSVVAVTLFLFLQPLAGALLGYFFLAERLNGLQCFGSTLILLAVLLPSALRLRNRTTH
ncbi:MAG: DMT family transporter [Bdellovibrionia bacterium]